MQLNVIILLISFQVSYKILVFIDFYHWFFKILLLRRLGVAVGKISMYVHIYMCVYKYIYIYFKKVKQKLSIVSTYMLYNCTAN